MTIVDDKLINQNDGKKLHMVPDTEPSVQINCNQQNEFKSLSVKQFNSIIHKYQDCSQK